MEKLKLKDSTEIEILDGASLGNITTVIGNYTDLSTLDGKLTKENLSHVQFVSGIVISAEYCNMVLTEPNYRITVTVNGLEVSFGLREQTEEERQQESVQTAITYLSDEQALTVKDLYPGWSGNSTDYAVGDRVLYMDSLYKCLQAHTSQETWAPETAPSLWAKILIPDPEIIPEWEQPDSTNGYSTGDKVKHNGKTWESLVDNNVWEPGVVGTEGQWREVTELWSRTKYKGAEGK